MKILQVKINALASKEVKENIEQEVMESISKGFIIHDNSVELNVLEFDEIKVVE